MRSLSLLALSVLSSVAVAQSPVYGQCGGQGWTGPTTCASGSYCSYSNPYYSQCIPGSGPGTTARPSTTVRTSTRPSSTVRPTTTVRTTSTVRPSTTVKPTTTFRTSSVQPTSTSPSTSGFSYLITFGDSYSQTGFDPNGAKASAANPLGNPGFPGYTTAGGSNWIGFLLKKYNRGRLLLSYNFAYGGATTDSALVTPYASTVLSFVDQVQQFITYLAPRPSYAPWTSANALFAVWIGVNDVGNAWGRSDWNTLSQQIVARYISQLQILYDRGARHIAILSVPPIQRTPAVQSQSASTIANEGAAILAFNRQLVAAVAQFKNNNPAVTTYVYDTVPTFNTVLDNPSSYGAPNALCYNLDGVSCLWWNDYHPGQAIQDLVAKGVAALVRL